MAKFKLGDAVKVTDFVGKVFKGEIVHADQGVFGVRAPEPHTTSDNMKREPYVWNFTSEELEREPFGDYGLRIEPWTEAEEPDPFTLLDDEGRKALKAGDRVLVEAEVEVPYPDHSGELQFKVLKGGTRIGLCWAGLGSVFALLPPAEKPIAVGDFVNILGRTGSQGKVLAFMSNGHAVVEYVAGDDFNVSHYDPSCLKVIS